MNVNIEEDIKIRTANEVAERVLGLIAAIGKVHFPVENQKWIEENDISQYSTPLELDFIETENPDHQDLVTFSWKAEALVSLVWCLKGIEEIPRFDAQFDLFSNHLVINAVRDPKEFLSSATLRSDEELDQMESYLYHQHWRVRDRDLGFHNDQPDESDPNIDELNTGIVYERRYGMSWVAGFGESWDEVPTDT